MSFGAIAVDYDRLRPAPPDAAVDWLLPDRCQVAVDLAAGTGLLSRALAGRVAQVIAVEPDHRMAAVLRARSPQIRVVEGRGGHPAARRQRRWRVHLLGMALDGSRARPC